jgi:formamidopyrimidine-DNA glycosylase
MAVLSRLQCVDLTGIRMPELPEVETVKRGLQPVMEGASFKSVDVRRAGLRWPFPQDMAQRLTGRQIIALRRRSKYILIDLSDNLTLLLHLGMSGRVLIHRGGQATPTGQSHDQFPPLQKHDHVVFDLTNNVRVVYNDPRRFGAMDLIVTSEVDDHPLIAKLGPEPLGNQFDAPYLGMRFKDRKSPVKSALLDQSHVCGLGNIYVCEALWRSGIAPTRTAGKISRPKLDILVRSIRDVLAEAIDSGGSSLKDFRQTSGDLGYFQHNFAVYDREGDPCRTPDCKGKIARIVQSGRSTFYCSKCQR